MLQRIEALSNAVTFMVHILEKTEYKRPELILFTLWNPYLPNDMKINFKMVITAHGDLDHACIGVIFAIYFSKETETL